MDGIGVCEKQPIAFRCLRSEPESMIFSGPAGGKAARAQNFEFGNRVSQTREDFWCAVGRLVIYDNDFGDFVLRGEMKCSE